MGSYLEHTLIAPSLALPIVVALVTSKDEDLAKAIQDSIQKDSIHSNLSHLFSRNKMLRRKFKREAAKKLSAL